ncbi:MAG: hypothetical protein PWP21_331 [Thermosediminibacterales bacterium]|nr:hypothetical protein [Thermosediminibacterales bacterium]
MRRVLSILIITIFSLILIITVLEMPVFGDIKNPTNNHVPSWYIENAIKDTGALNIVTSIILDYRGFDTLGEAVVLFLSTISVISILREA